jgi:RNA polymerase sigma-70 factor (ECF subfamily)
MDYGEFAARLLPMKDKIFRFARSIVSDYAEAEDVTQDIFERLWVRRSSLDECNNLEGFVMSSVRNLCYDRLRNRRMKEGKAASIREEMPSAVSETKVELKDAAEIVETLIAKLPERQRMVIHLRDVEGCEIETICEVLEADAPTVRVILSRARKSIREEMIKIMNYGIQ